MEQAQDENNAGSRAPTEHAPRAVLEAFQQRWPNVEILEVEQEAEDDLQLCEIKFREAGTIREVKYTFSGELLEIEEEIGLENLPAAARTARNSRFSGGEIVKVEKVTLADGGLVYESKVMHQQRLWEATLSPEGSITGVEEEQENESD